jgi:hypothetical protein
MNILKRFISRYLVYHPQERDYMMICKYLRVNNIRGSFIEFGVYKGDGIKLMNTMAYESAYQYTSYIGFDVFECMPVANGIDKEFNIRNQSFKTNKRIVQHNLSNISRLELIQGLFSSSLPNFIINNLGVKASCINIDCDYYHSTKDVIKHWEHLFQEGTIIIFDDWHLYKSSDYKGERKAFNEYKSKVWDFEELPTLSLIKCFICKKRFRDGR